MNTKKALKSWKARTRRQEYEYKDVIEYHAKALWVEYIAGIAKGDGCMVE